MLHADRADAVLVSGAHRDGGRLPLGCGLIAAAVHVVAAHHPAAVAGADDGSVALLDVSNSLLRRPAAGQQLYYYDGNGMRIDGWYAQRDPANIASKTTMFNEFHSET